MLERIHIENYKCLRDVTVELGDFTILIGPNDSGKSSFLEVIQTFGKLVRPDNANLFVGDHSLANLVWRKDTGRSIVMEAAGKSAGHRFVYHLEMPVNQPSRDESLEWDGKKLFWTDVVTEGHARRPPFNYVPGTHVIVFMTGQGQQIMPAQGRPFLPQFIQSGQAESSAIVEALASSLEYQFDLDQLPRPSIPQPRIVLQASGSNLAAVLDVMQNSPDREDFEALQRSLHKAIPTLRGIVLPPAPQPPGAKALEFILSGNGQPPVTIPGSLASGGALLLTAFLTVAYTETPRLLLFEEPENGLHPSRLQMVLDILRQMSRGEVGKRKRQIIVTTHNPLLLNYAHPKEVRVFVRDLEKGTRVVPMEATTDIDRLLKEFALGELWYLLGEEKLIEGQPA